jgi:iron complex outermembrane receptor protein
MAQQTTNTVLMGAGAMLLLTGAMASAQTAAPASLATEPAMETVIVTSQRREQRLQDVPSSITNITGAELSKLQIGDVKALSAQAPSLLITDTPVGKNNMIIGMRGISPTSISSNNDPTVGVYVNGVYYARTAGANGALVDMDNVEVIRGPQGTLFGRNTIGGALNMTTKAPTAKLEGKATVGFGNYKQKTLSGMLNIPLGESIAVRFVADALKHDGYGRSTTLNQPLGDEDRKYYRASLRANPIRDLQVDLYYDKFRSSAASQVWILNYFDPSIAAKSLAPLAAYVQPGGYDSAAGFNPTNSADVDTTSATLRWKGDGATFKSISAYRHLATVSGYDLDATPVFVNQLQRYGVSGHQFTQELQAYGDALGDRLEWIGGLYYLKEELLDSSLVTTPSGANTLGRLNAFTSGQTSASVFGQVTYALTPTLRATAGARYVSDKRDVDYNAPRYLVETGTQLAGSAGCALAAAGLDQGGCHYVPAGLKAHYVPWTLGLDFKPGVDTLLYAKISRGFRSGGFQPGGATNAFAYTPFDKESALSYEAGSKLMLFERRLRINLAAYLAKYDDIQQITPKFPPGSTTTISSVLNAGKADIRGIEIDAQWRLGALNLSAGAGLIDPEFTSGPYQGQPFVTAAKNNYTFGADYPLATALGALTLHLDYNWRSAVIFFSPVNTTPVVFTPLTAGQIASNTQPGFGLLSAMVSLELADKRTRISVWGKNLAGQYYWARSNSFYTQGYNNQTPGDPRTFGVTLDYRF